MDETITEERKERLKEYFLLAADNDVLTNADAMMIIEILKDACQRKKAEVCERLMESLIAGGAEE